MSSNRTTHELARMLEEVAVALREMPDVLLSKIQPTHSRKVKPAIDITELAGTLPHLNREEAESRLSKLGQKQLVDLCRQLKVNTGSKRTKESLVQQILWQFFEAKDELERIRTYEEKPPPQGAG